LRCAITDRLRARIALAPFVLAVVAAGFVPLFGQDKGLAAAAGKSFSGWPTAYEGRELKQLPLTQRESEFVRDFPGHVGRFSDGRREIIVRWVGAATRRLHPAADCFRGIGFSIAPIPLRKNAAGSAMSCFRASRGVEAMIICELIRDERGESWPDVSAWYWSSVLGRTPAPWWSFVVAERE
jgi:hypothetical protein